MTTQKMYETVLEEFGFTMQEGRFGNGPSLQLMTRGGNLCFADFRKRLNKTSIRLSGAGRGHGFDTGWLRVSEMQLNSLLTILVQNHF